MLNIVAFILLIVAAAFSGIQAVRNRPIHLGWLSLGVLEVALIFQWAATSHTIHF